MCILWLTHLEVSAEERVLCFLRCACLIMHADLQ